MSGVAADKAVSLRISVTDRCQLRCRYCMPPGGVAMSGREEILRFEEIVRFVGVLKRGLGLTKVRLTGGEPLIRRGIVDLVAMLAREGIEDLAMTTNGQLLAEKAADLKRARLRRVNVSMDSLRPDVFRTITLGGDLRATIAGIDSALREGLRPVKINVTVLRGVNSGELAEIARFGLERRCEVRFIELMPIGPVAVCRSAGQAGAEFGKWFFSSAEMLAALAGSFELGPLPRPNGSSARLYEARPCGEGSREGCQGIIGVIPSMTEPFCADCRRLRLTASGRLIGCLAREEGVDVRGLLRGGGSEHDLLRAVDDAMRMKQAGRDFSRQKAMVQIGG